MANGCHHNLSLWRGDENVFVEEDNPTLHVSETARNALGGILEHSRGMLALLAPTVNSYARYWDVGQFAPAVVNWGFDNRTCAVRVSASGRLEYKLPDASVNPFISHAAVLEAMADGLERGIDPGAAAVRGLLRRLGRAVPPAAAHAGRRAGGARGGRRSSAARSPTRCTTRSSSTRPTSGSGSAAP